MPDRPERDERADRTERPSFGTLLRAYRRAAGLSQEQLAERAALSADAVSTLERGVRQAPYRETVQRLAAALGLTADETARLHAAVARSRRAPDRASPPATVSPALAAPARPRWRLPAPPTPLIGRERELTEVRKALDGEGRLLTLTGVGGVGKTHLALHVAQAAAPASPDGAAFVALASVRDPGLVAPTLMHALGLRDTARATPDEALCAALAERTALLVLDNCEQVGAAVAALAAALLERCPGLRILATSRAALRLRGERIYLVPPLETPAPACPITVENLTRTPAVSLLVDRARAAVPTFVLTPENAAAVAALCRHLEGLPLALELAAPRLSVLSPAALLARLERRLPVLAGGPRDLPERQRTLRATLAWSDELLSPAEQALFRRLGVCAGGATAEAAEAICADDDLRRGAVVEWLAELVDKSLLRRATAPDGAVRLAMLETVREYALERLEQSGKAAETRRRHAAYYLALAERAEPELLGPAQAAWMQRLEAERDNLRAALAWAHEAAAHESGLRLAGALYRFWDARGDLSEGRRWLDELLARAGAEVAAPVRAKALHGAGVLAYSQSDYASASAREEEALTLYRAQGDRSGAAAALTNLGNVALDQGNYARASALYEEGLALRRAAGDAAGIATSLVNLALVAREQGAYARAVAFGEEGLALQRARGHRRGAARVLTTLGLVARDQGDLAGAHERFEESLAITRELGDTWGIALALANLSGVARLRGARSAAAELAEESLRLFAQVGDAWGRALALRNRGRVALDEGAWAHAAGLYGESLALSAAVGDAFGVPPCLEALAEVAGARGEPVQAARLCGAAAARRAAAGMGLAPADLADRDRVVATAQENLGADGWAVAWAAGYALTPDAAVAEARAIAERVATAMPARTPVRAGIAVADALVRTRMARYGLVQN